MNNNVNTGIDQVTDRDTKYRKVEMRQEKFDDTNFDIPEINSEIQLETLLLDSKHTITDINELIIIDHPDNKNTDNGHKKYELRKAWNPETPIGRITGKSTVEQYMKYFSEKYFTDIDKNIQQEVIFTIEKDMAVLTIQNELMNFQQEVANSPEQQKEIIADIKANIKESKEAIRLLKKNLKLTDKGSTTIEDNNIDLYRVVLSTIEDYLDNANDDNKWMKKVSKKGNEILMMTNGENLVETQRTVNELRKWLMYVGQDVVSPNNIKGWAEAPKLDIGSLANKQETAQIFKNIYNNLATEKQKINLILEDANVLKVIDEHGTDLKTYLEEAIIGKIDPAKDPFVPSKANEQAMTIILQTYPEIQKYVSMQTPSGDNKKNENTSSKKEIENMAGRKLTDAEYEKIQKLQEKTNTKGSILDNATPSFLTDFIDNSDREPGTKERAKKLSGLITMGGLIFLWWKTIENIRNGTLGDKTKFDWKRLAAWWAVFGGMYINSWNITNVKGITKDIQDWLGLGNGWSETEKTMGTWFNNMHALFAGMDYKTMNKFITEKDGKLTIDYTAMESFLDAAETSGTVDKIEVRKTALENFKEEDKYGLLGATMAAMGITKKDLEAAETDESKNKKYNEKAKDVIENVVKVQKYMEDKGYTKRNDELYDEIVKFIGDKSDKKSLKDLEKIGAFEKEENLEDNDKIEEQVDLLTTVDTKQKDNLKLQLLKVAKELRNNNSYNGTIEITEENSKIRLKTYDNKTELDIKNKQVQYDKLELTMWSTYEALKVANLTNRIQNIFKGKATKKYENIQDGPFKVSTTGNIEFDMDKPITLKGLFKKDFVQKVEDAIKGKTDVTVADGWWRGTLDDISPTLESKKTEYVRFLNTMSIWGK